MDPPPPSQITIYGPIAWLSFLALSFPPAQITIYGPNIGLQAIHMTKWGVCDMGWDMAAQYAACLPCITANTTCICQAVDWQPPAMQDSWEGR